MASVSSLIWLPTPSFVHPARYRGGPSEKVGILAGDRIIEVNDTVIAGVKMNTDEVMRRLRGPNAPT